MRFPCLPNINDFLNNCLPVKCGIFRESEKRRGNKPLTSRLGTPKPNKGQVGPRKQLVGIQFLFVWSPMQHAEIEILQLTADRKEADFATSNRSLAPKTQPILGWFPFLTVLRSLRGCCNLPKDQ